MGLQQDVGACPACGAASTVSAGAACPVCGRSRDAEAPPPRSVASVATPVAAPGADRAPHPPQPRRRRAEAGIARAVSWRTEMKTSGQTQKSITVLNFRLDRYDEDGGQLPGIAVEMRGSRFRGSISGGDWIETPSSWRSGQLQTPKQVRNLTTGTVVEADHPGRVLRAVGAVIGIAVFLFFAYLIFGMASP